MKMWMNVCWEVTAVTPMLPASKHTGRLSVNVSLGSTGMV